MRNRSARRHSAPRRIDTMGKPCLPVTQRLHHFFMLTAAEAEVPCPLPLLAAEPRNVSQPNRPRRSGQRSKSLLIKPEQPICINSIVRWRSLSVVISRRDSENGQPFLFVLFRVELAATRREVMSFCGERAIPLSVNVTFVALQWFKGMHDFQTDRPTGRRRQALDPQRPHPS